MIQLVGLVTGVVSIGASIYFLFLRIGECRSAKASANWLSPSGQITASPVRKFGFLRPAFVPFVEFAFYANGHEQTGKRIAYHVISSRDQKEANAIAEKYSVGTKVKVTYDPANPQDPALEPGPKGAKILTYEVIWFFCGGIFCVLTNLLL